MAVVVVGGKPVEVSDDVISIQCYGLRSYLQGKYDGNTKAKVRQVRCWLRGKNWKPSEVAALRKVLQELLEA